MNNKILIGICIFLLVINPSYAMVKAYESTSIARMVGDNPDDLIAQLDRGSLNLVHATSYVNDKWYQIGLQDVNNIIKEEFPNNKIKEGNINWNDVNRDVNSFSKNELFVLSPDYNDVMNYEGLTPGSVSWNFRDKEPLWIFDSKYAGLYLPKKDSFVGKLSRYSTVIAPLSYSSKEMVKAVVCNLKNGNSIGDSFRQARNNYYWGTEANEPIGLTMLSYELYGDPNSMVYLPNYKQSIIDKYCDNYNEEYKKNSEVKRTMLAGVNNNIGVNYEVDLKNYNIEKIENYDLLTFENAIQKNDNYELVLPQIIHKTEYPSKTIIRGFGASFEDPVELIINLPEWQEGFVEKNCYEESKDKYASFAQSFTRDKEVVLAYINPVEVVNCSTGRVKLYKTIKYWIDYSSYSNVLIKEVKTSETAQPNSSVKLNTKLENIGSNPESGILKIKDGESVLKEENVVLNSGESKDFDIEFNAPEYDGTKVMSVVYESNGLVLTQSDFSIQIINNIYAPDPDNPNCPPRCVGLNLWIYNKDCAIIAENIIPNYKFCYPQSGEIEKNNDETEKNFCIDYCAGNTLYKEGHFYEGSCVYKTEELNSASCNACLSFEDSKQLYLPKGDHACPSSYIPTYNEPGSTDKIVYYKVKLSDVVCSPEGSGKYRKVAYNSSDCGYVDSCFGIKCDDKCDGFTMLKSGRCVNGGCVYDYSESNSLACNYDPCSNVVCNNYCDGYSYYKSIGCSSGFCQYSIEGNSKSCGYIDPCENVACNDGCGKDNDKYTMYQGGKCVSGKCIYNVVGYKSKQCGYDPCMDTKCYDYCDGSKSLHSSGKCSDGKCSYPIETKNSDICINPICSLIGDTDNNKKIDIFDNLNILGVMGESKPYPANICCYDVSRNGKIDVMDVIGLLNILNGDKQPEPSSLC